MKSLLPPLRTLLSRNAFFQAPKPIWTKTQFCPHRAFKRRTGISGLEILGLLGLTSFLLPSLLPLVPQFQDTRALKVSGDRLAQMIAAAREHAMVHKTLTALILLTDHSSDANYRTFTIAERNPDGRWRQITSWETLADGVTFDLDPRHCSFLDGSPSLPGFAQNQIAFQDESLDREDFACRMFLPAGNLSPLGLRTNIRLVEGMVKGAGSDVVVNYHESDQDGPARFYDITIAAPTGTLSIHQK